MKNNIGGEQSYQTIIEEAVSDEDDRYQRFLANILKNEVERDEEV